MQSFWDWKSLQSCSTFFFCYEIIWLFHFLVKLQLFPEMWLFSNFYCSRSCNFTSIIFSFHFSLFWWWQLFEPCWQIFIDIQETLFHLGIRVLKWPFASSRSIFCLNELFFKFWAFCGSFRAKFLKDFRQNQTRYFYVCNKIQK